MAFRVGAEARAHGRAETSQSSIARTWVDIAVGLGDSAEVLSWLVGWDLVGRERAHHDCRTVRQELRSEVEMEQTSAHCILNNHPDIQ